MPQKYWLMKSEPETYSFDQLVRDKKTNWNDVRNFQARNYLKEVKKGDLVLIYHSGEERAVVGVAKCVREAYPDIEPEDGKEWVQVDLAPEEKLKKSVSLATIKATPALVSLPLIKQSRLSVMPVTEAHFKKILELSKK